MPHWRRLVNQGSNWLVAGKSAQRQGSTHPNIAPTVIHLPTSDGALILLAVGNDKKFAELCMVLDIPGMMVNPIIRPMKVASGTGQNSPGNWLRPSESERALYCCRRSTIAKYRPAKFKPFPRHYRCPIRNSHDAP